MIKVNFEKAQEITKARLRAERQPLLEALDVEILRYIGDSKKMAEINGKKQELRDVTKKVDIATTLDELKGLRT